MPRTLDSGTFTIPSSSPPTISAGFAVTAVTQPVPARFRGAPRAVADPAIFIPSMDPESVSESLNRVITADAWFIRDSGGFTETALAGRLSHLLGTEVDVATVTVTRSEAAAAPTQAWVVFGIHAGHPDDIVLDWELLGPTRGTLAVALAGLAGGGGGTMLAGNKRRR